MTNIQFGWLIPQFPQDKSTAPEFAAQIIHNLNQIKDTFDSAWKSDHFLAAPNQAVPECWTTLCYLAHAFPSLQFGTQVIGQSYRNPALLASMGATLQLLSGGRLILGIGAGWMEQEYTAYGYDFPSAAVRIQQLEEAVQIIRKLWTETPATFEGTYYHIRDAICEPKPDPLPPILIGGTGEHLTLRAIARHADWCHINVPDVERYAHKLSVLRTHCHNIGRDYDEIKKTWGGFIAIGATESEAQHIAEQSTFREYISIVGNPKQVVAQLHEFVRLGVDHFILGFADFPDPRGASLVANAVIPAFR